VTQLRRLGGDSETAAVSWGADNISVRPLAASAIVRAEVGRILALVDVEEPIRRRVVQDALNDALACTWTRRAELLEFAMSRPEDYHGQATAEQIAERDRHLAAQASACRHKAILLELHILDDFEAVPDVHR
jgi:hypothetical protein